MTKNSLFEDIKGLKMVIFETIVKKKLKELKEEIRGNLEELGYEF